MLAVALAAIAAGAIVVGVTSGGGHGANAARHGRAISPNTAPGTLAVAAGYLGIPRSQLNEELRSGRTLAQVANATGDKSAKGLIDALVSARAKQLRARAAETGTNPAMSEKARLARLRRRAKALVDKIPGYVGLPATARYLGVSVAQLRTELGSGRSLAQIADATPGKSASGLIGARVSTRQAILESAFAAGRITKATESALLSASRERITSEVDRTPAR